MLAHQGSFQGTGGPHDSQRTWGRLADIETFKWEMHLARDLAVIKISGM
jgi:hypothetical protein